MIEQPCDQRAKITASEPGSTSCFIYYVTAKTTWSNRSGVLGFDTAIKMSWYKVLVNQESSYFDKAVHYRYLCFVFVKITVYFIALKDTILLTFTTATKLLSDFVIIYLIKKQLFFQDVTETSWYKKYFASSSNLEIETKHTLEVMKPFGGTLTLLTKTSISYSQSNFIMCL